MSNYLEKTTSALFFNLEDIYYLQLAILNNSTINNPYLSSHPILALDKSLKTENKQLNKAINELNTKNTELDNKFITFSESYNEILGDTFSNEQLKSDLNKIDENLIAALIKIYKTIYGEDLDNPLSINKSIIEQLSMDKDNSNQIENVLNTHFKNIFYIDILKSILSFKIIDNNILLFLTCPNESSSSYYDLIFVKMDLSYNILFQKRYSAEDHPSYKDLSSAQILIDISGIYITSINGTLKIDINSGNILWENSIQCYNGTPFLYNNKLYLYYNNKIYILDINGNILNYKELSNNTQWIYKICNNNDKIYMIIASSSYLWICEYDELLTNLNYHSRYSLPGITSINDCVIKDDVLYFSCNAGSAANMLNVSLTPTSNLSRKIILSTTINKFFISDDYMYISFLDSSKACHIFKATKTGTIINRKKLSHPSTISHIFDIYKINNKNCIFINIGNNNINIVEYFDDINTIEQISTSSSLTIIDSSLTWSTSTLSRSALGDISISSKSIPIITIKNDIKNISNILQLKKTIYE